MACLSTYPEVCSQDLNHELHWPRARLVRGDYALVPVSHQHRTQPDRPLSHHINHDSGHDTHCVLRSRSSLGGVADGALIDRASPYECHSCHGHCRSHPHLYDDTEDFDVPDPNWRFSYSYPLHSMASGGVRWSPAQIQAYNREVLRHNNLIARRRVVGAPGEYMMLHPMMDSHGRFSPGLDRPVSIEEFFRMDEPHLDNHCHHYGLPTPTTLEGLLIFDPTAQHLRHQLRRIQLLSVFGAYRLAEQLAVQLLAAQQVLPDLGLPSSLGHGLGPEFDDTYLSPLLSRNHGGGVVPLEALGYGSGLSNWNWAMLPQLRGAWGGGGGGGGSGGDPGAAAHHQGPWGARTGMYPPLSALPAPPGMGRAHGFPSSRPGLPYPGEGWGSGQMSGFTPRGMNLGVMGGGGGSPSNNFDRIMQQLSCDGGASRRVRKFQ